MGIFFQNVSKEIHVPTLRSKYGVSSDLLQALQFLYRNSSACVGINGAYSVPFVISRGVREGCIASPRLFMNGCLRNLKEHECENIRMDELLVNCLLYADGQVIIGPSACDLQECRIARRVSRQSRLAIHNGILNPMLMCGSEKLGMAKVK
ncbi:hypothetical protein EVAR_52986_1 [Eumeta japonica]|uniref:Reverse transcriptase domain-containing protein n=1 Tax=Eumeta variegata TaxID=151549 RepID=A0A4C1Z8X3_EUMVA|nr:hypothetical protein EVAR_52986_1 [Eumeta japonica]